MTDLVETGKVKKQYMKANLIIHPDKVHLQSVLLSSLGCLVLPLVIPTVLVLTSLERLPDACVLFTCNTGMTACAKFVTLIYLIVKVACICLAASQCCLAALPQACNSVLFALQLHAYPMHTIPDKCHVQVKQKGGTVEQIVIADMAFDVLKTAWAKFESGELRK